MTWLSWFKGALCYRATVSVLWYQLYSSYGLGVGKKVHGHITQSFMKHVQLYQRCVHVALWVKNIFSPPVSTIQRSFLLFHFAVWLSKGWRSHCVDSHCCNCCRQWHCGNTVALMLFQIRRWHASFARSSPEATSWSTMRQSTPSAEREFTHVCVFPRSLRRYRITRAPNAAAPFNFSYLPLVVLSFTSQHTQGTKQPIVVIN